MTPRKRFYLGLGVCAILVVGAMAWRNHNTVLLPDGERVQLAETTYGKTHQYVAKGSVLQPIEDYLPGIVPWKLPPVTVRDIWGIENSIVCWFTPMYPSSGQLSSIMLNDFRVMDEHGCLVSVGKRKLQTWNKPAAVAAVEFENFPRRQREFRLAFYANNELIGQCMIPNPLPIQAASVWKPEPLPTTLRNGDLAVTLCKVNWTQSGALLLREPEFEVRENGRLTREWQPHDMRWCDATGLEVRYNEPLCLHEPAWKLKVSFWKEAGGTFASNEVWTVPGIVSPSDDKESTFTASGTVNGVSLQVMNFANPGQFWIWDGKRVRTRSEEGLKANEVYVQGHSRTSRDPIIARFDKPHVVVQAGELKKNQWIYARIVDSGGKAIVAEKDVGDSVLHVFPFSLPPDIKNASLQVIVHEEQEFGFFVKPPERK
jgi:hypothetical protein